MRDLRHSPDALRVKNGRENTRVVAGHFQDKLRRTEDINQLYIQEFFQVQLVVRPSEIYELYKRKERRGIPQVLIDDVRARTSDHQSHKLPDRVHKGQVEGDQTNGNDSQSHQGVRKHLISTLLIVSTNPIVQRYTDFGRRLVGYIPVEGFPVSRDLRTKEVPPEKPGSRRVVACSVEDQSACCQGVGACGDGVGGGGCGEIDEHRIASFDCDVLRQHVGKSVFRLF
mmetsp:Transcript_15526/g.27853  ORF Transcript_15526/g.27853 Transcript_15526/m.27853 type:complete len:227 (-) Transcript_15526:1595-2275(-)